MAIPRGGFKSGAAGITAPGGAFSYLAPGSGVLWGDPGTGDYPQFYAGMFLIDTGYDDPVLWTAGVDCAEVYAARVYAKTGVASPSVPADTYLGKWNIAATPVWQSKFWALPTSNTNTQRRILIQCEVYLSEPVSIADGSYQRLDSVDWSLYRV